MKYTVSARYGKLPFSGFTTLRTFPLIIYFFFLIKQIFRVKSVHIIYTKFNLTCFILFKYIYCAMLTTTWRSDYNGTAIGEQFSSRFYARVRFAKHVECWLLRSIRFVSNRRKWRSRFRNGFFWDVFLRAAFDIFFPIRPRRIYNEPRLVTVTHGVFFGLFSFSRKIISNYQYESVWFETKTFEKKIKKKSQLRR